MIDRTAALTTLAKIQRGEEVHNAPAILRITERPERVQNKSGNGYRLLVRMEGLRYPVTVWDRDVPAMRHAVQTCERDDTGAFLLPVRITATTSDEWYNVTARPFATVTDAAEVFA